jgi:hypothetical protein
MILPVTVPVTVARACLTVTASGCCSHDSSFTVTVTVTLLNFAVTLSDIRVRVSPSRRDSEPRAGLHRDRCSAAQRWRPGLQWPAGAGQMLDSGMVAGPLHGRQQFLKQEFSWKNRETFALLSMRTSLAATGSQPCHGLGDCQWHAFKFLHWCPGRQT